MKFMEDTMVSITLSDQKVIRNRADTDELILECRFLARTKITRAIREDGTLDWGKLPKLIGVNRKLIKEDRYDPYLTAGFQGSPAWASGYNTCAGATLGCTEVCIHGSGHGQRHMIYDGTHHVWVARIVRTILLYEYREQFEAQLLKEIEAFIRKAERKDYKTAFRPNVITDIDWVPIMPSIFKQNIDKIYDYTKVAERARTHIRPSNYHLTISRHENTIDEDIHNFMRWVNVAVVFSTKKGKPLPSKYLGYPVFDGDVTDNRFNDPVGHIIGLREKKTGKVDNTGFVVQV